MMSDAGATRHGTRPAARPAASLAGAAEGAQGWILDGRLIVVRQGQLHEAVEVFKNLWVPLHGRLPVLVDAALQLCLRSGDLVGMRRCVVIVIGMGGDTV